MKEIYYKQQLLRFSMEEYRKKFLLGFFICETKSSSFICLIKNIIPSQPDNLPYSIIVQTEKESKMEILVSDIESLTKSN